jgi:transcriptional antiterminator NusG
VNPGSIASEERAKHVSEIVRFGNRAVFRGVSADWVLTMSSDDAATASDTTSDETMRWYVLKVQSNRERTIRENILRRAKRERLDPYFGQIIIPTEKVAETKGGKKRVVEQKMFPGYLMVQMVLNDETWFLIRETSGVGDFTGAAGKPIPMQDHEIQRMLGLEVAKQETNQPKIKISFHPGDRVKIKEGTFENWEGTVESIDEHTGRVTVLVDIFGRSTPVSDLEYWQVESI